jgi:hypothetical protein
MSGQREPRSKVAQRGKREEAKHSAHSRNLPEVGSAFDMGLATMLLGEPRALSPETAIALQQRLGNDALQRLALSPVGDRLQRGDGDEAEGGGTGARQGTMPFNIDRSISVGSDYQLRVQLGAEIRWNPFSVRLTGEENGISIRQGEEERGTISFGPGGEFQELSFSTDRISATMDSEGPSEVELEIGGLTVRIDREERQASMTLDILGMVWPAEMRRLAERVGEVTSDFDLVFGFPEGADSVRLDSIGVTLGVGIGPEQARVQSELSIETDYTEAEGGITTASGSIVIELNIFGINRTIPIYEEEARAGDIYYRYERRAVEVALRAAFEHTALGLPEAEAASGEGVRDDIVLRALYGRFNERYVQAYQQTRQRIIEHYQTEFELTDVRLANGHAGAPITMVPVGRNMFDAYCRGVVLGNILPDPDPPGGVVVEVIWGNLISRHSSAPR